MVLDVMVVEAVPLKLDRQDIYAWVVDQTLIQEEIILISVLRVFKPISKERIKISFLQLFVIQLRR